MVQIDGAVETAPGEKAKLVVVLGATNLPWDLDPAVIRRLDKRIYIPLPEPSARKKLFQILLKDTKVEEGIDWDLLVTKTELFSGDDLKNLCRDASMMPLRRELLRGPNLSALEAAKPTLNVQEVQARLQETPISMQDFVEALEGIRPTNGRDKLDKYRQWMDEHGST